MIGRAFQFVAIVCAVVYGAYTIGQTAAGFDRALYANLNASLAAALHNGRN